MYNRSEKDKFPKIDYLSLQQADILQNLITGILTYYHNRPENITDEVLYNPLKFKINFTREFLLWYPLLNIRKQNGTTELSNANQQGYALSLRGFDTKQKNDLPEDITWLELSEKRQLACYSLFYQKGHRWYLENWQAPFIANFNHWRRILETGLVQFHGLRRF